jgi:hypothetical protein
MLRLPCLRKAQSAVCLQYLVILTQEESLKTTLLKLLPQSCHLDRRERSPQTTSRKPVNKNTTSKKQHARDSSFVGMTSLGLCCGYHVSQNSKRSLSPVSCHSDAGGISENHFTQTTSSILSSRPQGEIFAKHFKQTTSSVLSFRQRRNLRKPLQAKKIPIISDWNFLKTRKLDYYTSLLFLSLSQYHPQTCTRLFYKFRYSPA